MIKKTFTLIELIVVIAIIAVLAAIIAPNAFKAIEKAKISQALSDLKALKTAIGALYVDTGRWAPLSSNHAFWLASVPAYSAGLNEYYTRHGLMNNEDYNGNTIPGWDGPYLENARAAHPWGGIYTIYLDSQSDPDGSSNIVFQNSHTLRLDRKCFSEDKFTCYVPESSAVRIDSFMDDGDIRTGRFIKGNNPGTGGEWNTYCWFFRR
ncbi:MAG: prepilin-type N-terminal cleavage/methylation domain-containing protein [Candidatus Omnitrophica bacterium]|nr:prepilin-type N-terminal cleavage/methylation domain-containing protein [Candidatus Omnitrophota bacterium]MDD5430193.1 prepilin-type N-terminal cleavage/methylation domain-containing protein [Candidatus Omnitrophota bacterium]